ncbi:hypothetical protein Tco_0878648 [Tanacetum coccineum]|uniref:Uncharacterized protein n=1 Tax=Tanacetum coccineum TaxID=301880 RepID=A0ABQ5C0U3_9ASTR
MVVDEGDPVRSAGLGAAVTQTGEATLGGGLNITAALIDVNTAQSKLVLLENFNENYSKCLRLLVKLLLLEEVTTARGSYYC